MIDRVSLRQAVIATLKAANTLVGQSVFSPLDWPTWTGQYPLIIVRTPRERRTAISGALMGVPQFNSSIEVVVVGRVENTTEAGAEADLETLSRQIENAILQNSQFIYQNEVQQFPSVETSMQVNSEARTHLGETVVTFEVEVYQVFEQTIDAAGASTNPGTPLTEIQGTIQDPATGVTLETFDVQLPQS